jgi:peptidoglycan/xylan/chitin deacetylase (PgdA/CDA1 family)
MMYSRNFQGYAGHPPHAQWPDDARVAVSLVLNIEEGAELTLSAGDESNEAVHEIVSGLEGEADLCMESHFEYGSRAGYWRIVELLQRFGATVTLNVCARALETTPWIAQHATQNGYEIMCHGYRWEAQVHMGEAQERAMIKRCVDSISAIAGQRPLGWHTKSQPSVNTRRLLVEEGGFLYDSNAYNDDLPYLVEVAGKNHVVVPYSFDTNDMRFQAGRGFELAGDFSRYCIDAFDWLWREGATRPKMMTIGLHTRIIGRPGRIGGLETFLRHITGKGKVWIARRDDIARHWLTQGHSVQL